MSAIAVSRRHKLDFGCGGNLSAVEAKATGTRGRSPIVNLQSTPSAILTCIDLTGGPRLETDPTACRAFRPKAA